MGDIEPLDIHVPIEERTYLDKNHPICVGNEHLEMLTNIEQKCPLCVDNDHLYYNVHRILDKSVRYVLTMIIFIIVFIEYWTKVSNK